MWHLLAATYDSYCLFTREEFSIVENFISLEANTFKDSFI